MNLDFDFGSVRTTQFGVGAMRTMKRYFRLYRQTATFKLRSKK